MWTAFIVVSKMHLYNHCRHLVKLCHSDSILKSYVSNGKEYVYVNDVDSSLRNTTCGVLQGSVEVPLLFLIYMNDIDEIAKHV